VKHVQETLKVSERLVCKALCQARASQRYKAKLRDGEAVLVTRIHEMLRRHPLPRRGFRMICGMLPLDDWEGAGEL